MLPVFFSISCPACKFFITLSSQWQQNLNSWYDPKLWTTRPCSTGFAGVFSFSIPCSSSGVHSPCQTTSCTGPILLVLPGSAHMYLRKSCPAQDPLRIPFCSLSSSQNKFLCVISFVFYLPPRECWFQWCADYFASPDEEPIREELE